MDLYTIEVKKFKTAFFQTQIINLITIIASFVLIKNGLYILSVFDASKKLTSPILLGMVVLAIAHSQYQRKQLKKITDIIDFDARVVEYEKFYKLRMLWVLFSCLVSCFLTVLTGRYVFLYFAGLDILISLPYYPGLNLVKRELKNNEVILY